MTGQCTPKYNQETRDRMRERDALRRVKKGMDTGDFGATMRAKAHDLIDEGKSAQEVLASVHEYVNKFATHSKEEVLSAINHSKRAAPTQDKAHEQRAKIRAELRDLEAVKKEAESKPRQPPTHDQKVAVRERQLEKEIDGLNNGIERTKGEPLSSEQITKLKAERDGLKNHLHSPDEREIADLEARIAEFDKPDAEPKSKADSERVTALKERLKAMQDAKAALSRDRANPAVSADNAEQARLKNRIAEIDRQLAGGSPEGKPQGADSQAVTELKAARDAKQAELDASRKARQPTEEDRKVAALEKQLADLNKQREGPEQNRPDTKRVAEARAKLEEARAARDAANKKPPADPTETYNKTRQTVLKKQLAELERRIAENDFGPAKKRTQKEMDETTQALQKKLGRARMDAYKAINEFDRANRSRPQKAWERFIEVRRAALFAKGAILYKLTAAALLRHGLTPAELGTEQILKHLPYLKGRIYSRTDYAGGSFSSFLAGEKAALSPEAFKQSFFEAGSKLTGDSSLKAEMAGLVHDFPELGESIPGLKGLMKHIKSAHDVTTTEHVLAMSGRIHDVIKTTPEISEYHRAMARLTAAERARKRAEGMSEREIDAHMTEPRTLAIIQLKSFVHSQEAKFQQDNAAADAVNNAITFLGNKENFDKTPSGAANVVGGALEFATPVKKTAFNILSETTNYMVGGIKAALKIRATKGEPLTAEQADLVAKYLRKQTVGAAAAVVAVLFAEGFGGFWHEGEKKKKPNDIPFGAARFGGVDVSKNLVHGPLPTTMAIVADATHAFKKEKSVSSGIGSALATSGADALSEVPGWRSVEEFIGVIKNPKSTPDYLGRQAASFIPGFVGEMRQQMDSKKRYPRGFVQQIENKVPGLSQNVPDHKTRGN